MLRLLCCFFFGLLLFYLGWDFYSDRNGWQFSPVAYASLPSLIFGLSVVLVGSLLLAHNKRNLALLLLLVIGSEVGQALPFWADSVRFDWADLLASTLGFTLSAGMFWRSKNLQTRLGWPFVLIGSWAAVVGCYDAPLDEPDIAEPVVTPRHVLQQNVKITSWRNGLEYQRLYAKDGFLFGVVIGEGVQVIDNTDPFQPKAINFVHIPGSHEVVIQGDTFIANNYADLVFFSLAEQRELSRIPELYSYRDYIELPPNTIWNEDYVMPENHVAVDYKIVEDDDDREKDDENSDPVCIVLLCMLY